MSTRALFVGQRFNQVQTGLVLTTPLVLYTGASGGLTFCSDFVTYEKVQFDVKGVAGKGNVVRKGMVLRKFRTRCDNIVYITSHSATWEPTL